MKIAILGDLSVTSNNRTLFEKQEIEPLFADVPSIWEGFDHVIVNLETAVTNRGHEIKKFGPCLRAPLGTVESLKKIGITEANLSNNHIFDFGKIGLEDTLNELQKNHIPYTGIGENYEDSRRNMLLTDGKIKVAMINVCEHEYSYALPDRVGARPYDPYDTLDDVEEAKKEADYVIVVYHGGKELCQVPSPRLRKLCRSLVKHGADVVLCQHSHCIGCYEKYLDGHILYGQGNFHFVYNEEEKKAKHYTGIWDRGLAVLLNIQEKVDIQFVPFITNEVGIELAKGKVKDEIMQSFEKRSRSLLDDSYLNEWAEFCHRPSYYGGLVKDEDVPRLAHYLDCEAHTDVLRELYPTYNLTNEKD